MANTWLTPSNEGHAYRLLLQSSILCGLIQKPLIVFAWDVVTMMDIISGLVELKASPLLLAGTAILLRQVFAEKAQKLVGEMASVLAKSGRRWATDNLKRLHKRLLELQPKDAGKRKGRMCQFSGPAWLQNLLADSNHVKTFFRAAVVVAEMFNTTANAVPPTVADVCNRLQAKANKLPMVGKYSVPHLVRACYVCRFHIDGRELDMGDGAWSKHLREMTADRTSNIFDKLQVFSEDDALAMLRAHLGMLRAVYHRNTLVKHKPASLCDLACQACELGGVLGAVKKYRKTLRTNTHERGVAIDVPEMDDVKWLLARLPTDEAEQSNMKKLLAGTVSMADGKGDGKDLQCSGSITMSWLNTSPPEVPGSFYHVLDFQIRLPYQLPTLRCRECDATIVATHERHQDGQELCRSCCLNVVAVRDRNRQQVKRQASI